MDNLGFYLISSCLYFMVLWESLDIFFECKEISRRVSLCIWIIFYVVEIAEAVVIEEPVCRLMFQIVCTYLFNALLYRGSVRKRLIWIVCFNLLGSLCEMFVAYLFLVLGIDAYQNMTLGSMMSKILMLSLLTILKLFRFSRIKEDISFKSWCSLFGIMMGNLAVAGTMLYVCKQVEDTKVLFLAALSSAFLLVVDLWVIYVYDTMVRQMEMKREQNLSEKQIEMFKDQVRKKEELNQNIRTIRHDIKNHLLCIQECLEREDLASAEDYIEDLLQGSHFLNEKSCLINTGNLAIDALLNYKGLVMGQMGIRFKSRIEIPSQIGMKDTDICVILGNCLDNAIEAVSRIQEDERKYISIELIYRKKVLLCRIINPYSGNTVKDKNGNYISTKRDIDEHGIGLVSVKKAVEDYDGQIEIISEDGIFSVRILLYLMRKNYI